MIAGARHTPGARSTLHQQGETHFELLRAFAPDEALKAALDHAGREGYLSHEFGDAMVVI